MTIEEEIEYMAGYVYLVMDCKITQDLQDGKLGYGVNTITSPYGNTYIQNVGRKRYGNVVPFKITGIGLNKLVRMKNYESWVAEKLISNQYTPIDIGYYLMLAAAYTIVATDEGVSRDIVTNEPAHSRSLFFANVAKSHISQALKDIISEFGNLISLEEFQKIVKDEIINYLYSEGTYGVSEQLMSQMVNESDEAFGNLNTIIKS